MSDSDLIRYLKTLGWGGAVAIVMAALWALVVAWHLGASSSYYSKQAQEAAVTLDRDANQDIADTCLYRPDFVECAKKVLQDSQEAQTDQHDLAAQRSMALWAGAMFWATVASVGATSIGIVLVRRTLDVNRAAVEQAKQANGIAKDIGEAQVRAYLSIEEPSIGFDGQRPAFRMRLRNAGNSPAMFIRASCRVTFGFWDLDGSAEAGSQMIMVGGLSSGQGTSELFFPFEVRLSDHTSANRVSMAIRLSIDLEWINVFDRDDGTHSSFIIQIMRPLDDENVCAVLLPESMSLGRRVQIT